MNLKYIKEKLIEKYNLKEIIHIEKGWSFDIKFYVKTINDLEYLIRLSDIKSYKSKKAEYENLSKLISFNDNISKPIEFGHFDDQYLYMLLSWVKGEDAEITIKNYEQVKQYELGQQAGRILQNIHSIKYPHNSHTWFDLYDEKINRTITEYKKCGLTISFENLIIDYINSNKYLLQDREITFQHGDFNIGIFLINNGSLGIIDFNRSDIGDPWEEFDRYVFTWSKSEYFATGLIDQYLNFNIPDAFFKVICLYSARNILASIAWAKQFGEKEINVMYNNAQLIYDSYDGFNKTIPNWYKNLINMR